MFQNTSKSLLRFELLYGLTKLAVIPSAWTFECVGTVYFDEAKPDDLSQNVKEKTDFLRKFTVSSVQQALV